MGYAEYGLAPDRADAALLKAVELARTAAAEFPQRRVLVAASLGPCGAALHNGAEYHGNYDCTFGELADFHRERIDVLAGSNADVLAFETLLPARLGEEGVAIGEALRPYPGLAAWFSFTCKGDGLVAHGEKLRDCARRVAALPQTVAIGVNCTHPELIVELIGELRAASGKPIIAYPNSGEGWDAAARCWTGKGDPESFAAHAAEWFRAGAQIVSGCCRTRPAHIRLAADASLRIKRHDR